MTTLWNNTNPEPTGDTVWSDTDSYRGEAASITIGGVEAVVQGEESVINVGSPNDAVLNFKLPIGNDGEQGIQGIAGTIEIGDVSTGAAGTDVIITNVGSPSQAVLDITIPKGIQGIQGLQGIQGVQGIQGEKGDTGTAGATTYAALTDKSTVDLPATNTPLSTALSGKQASLVSGTNIKTVNSTSVLGSGNIAVQPTLVSGTNIKTVYGISLLGSGDIAQICGSQVFSVGRSTGSGTVTVGGTFGNLNDVYVDHANLNKTTGTFTIPVSGTYQLNVRALKTANSQNLQIALRINGSITRHAVVIDGVAPYISYLPVPLTHIAYFTAGQAIDVVVQLGTAHGDAEFTFSGYRVS